jgi:hypothetical protein
MSSFWNFFFGFVLIILWVIAGAYITTTNIALRPYENLDSDIYRADTFAFWAAFVTWFLVALFVVLLILSGVGIAALFGSGAGEAGVAAEGVESEAALSRYSQAKNYAYSPQGQSEITTGISWGTIAFLIFAMILIFVTGVLSALAASSLVASPNYNPSMGQLKKAYDDAVIAAIICLSAGGLLIIGIIVYSILGVISSRKVEAQKAAIQKQQEAELAEIDRLKQEEFEQKLAHP